MNEQPQLKLLTFDGILPYWRILWPGRQSPIEPVSHMMLSGEHKKPLSETAVFMALVLGDQVIGVNSYHKAEHFYVTRMRGLWIAPEHRGKGYGEAIIRHAAWHALAEGHTLMWSFPRQSSIRAHEKVGFVRVSEWMDSGEFGPNSYAVLTLRHQVVPL
jgi:GNAT superfamily N-acetyltransferase